MSHAEPKPPAAFHKTLQTLLRARYSLVHINTFEEDRCLRAIEALAAEQGQQVIVWSTTRGVRPLGGEADGAMLPMADLTAAIELFDKLASDRERHPGGYIFVLLDPYVYLADRSANPIYRRRLRDLAIDIRTRGYRASCLIVSPALDIPLELEKEMTVIDFPLPSRGEIEDHISSFVSRVKASKLLALDPDPQLIAKLVDASVGLTMLEVENGLARAIVDHRSLSAADVKAIFQQKQQIIRKSGILEYIDTRDLGIDDIGGLARLKEWLRVRYAAFSPEGQAFGIEPPKGVLLTGVPGCGKSWSAQCVASSWHLPLVRLDMGKVYSALVGSSESHMRDAIRVTESVAPCVLWIDEIEKGLPRPGNYQGDSGVSLRVLGSFLTWLQERVAPVFVFATANETDLLPPEILRKGRFDEIFFVDLPQAAERREIIQIHLRRAGRDPAAFDLDELVALSEPGPPGSAVALTGAEIAAWVNEALIQAFDRRHEKPDADLAMADFRAAIRDMVPLARIRQDEIRRLRDWAAGHARGASDSAASTAGDGAVGRDLAL